MTYPKRDLDIIAECNETGKPICWAMLCGRSYEEGDEIGSPSKNHYLWISKYGKQEYIVEDSNGYNLAGKVYKTLQGARREAEGIAFRQEETGCFSD